MIQSIKQWLKSWTINYGLLLVSLGSLEVNFSYLKNIIPEKYYGLLFVVVGVLVVVLRFKTTTAVNNK